jgi:hypothetical protein
MARYVLVEFDNNGDAEGFVTTITDPSNTGFVRIVGVYMKPTQFCKCSNPGDKSLRGQKYGLMVHKDCGKPKVGVWQSPRNLLLENEKPAGRKLSLNLVEPRARN